MNRETIANIGKFLERAQATGPECYAWVDAHQCVKAMLADIDNPPTTAASNVSSVEIPSA